MVPDESDMLSINKEKLLANIDVAMGGHIAEKLFLGDLEVTTGCSSDLKGATDMAYEAVRKYGMFGDEVGFQAVCKKNSSEERNQLIDLKVKQILDESHERVLKLLTQKDKEIRELSKNLFWHDYLDKDEIDQIMKGKQLKKERVRDWDKKETSPIRF